MTDTKRIIERIERVIVKDPAWRSFDDVEIILQSLQELGLFQPGSLNLHNLDSSAKNTLAAHIIDTASIQNHGDDDQDGNKDEEIKNAGSCVKVKVIISLVHESRSLSLGIQRGAWENILVSGRQALAGLPLFKDCDPMDSIRSFVQGSSNGLAAACQGLQSALGGHGPVSYVELLIRSASVVAILGPRLLVAEGSPAGTGFIIMRGEAKLTKRRSLSSLGGADADLPDGVVGAGQVCAGDALGAPPTASVTYSHTATVGEGQWAELLVFPSAAVWRAREHLHQLEVGSFLDDAAKRASSAGLTSLAPETIASLKLHVERVEVGAGEVLVRKGEPASALFILCRGLVRRSEPSEEVERFSVVGTDSVRGKSTGLRVEEIEERDHEFKINSNNL